MGKSIGFLAVMLFGGYLVYSIVNTMFLTGVGPILAFEVSNDPFPIGWLCVAAIIGGVICTLDND